MAKAKKKRRPEAPNWARKTISKADSKAIRAIKKANTARMRQLIAAVRARTAAGRAELDRLMKGADMRDLAHLPVMTGSFKAPGMRTKRGYPSDDETIAVLEVVRERPPIAPPVPEEVRGDEGTLLLKPGKKRRGIYRCSDCRKAGHRAGSVICRQRRIAA